MAFGRDAEFSETALVARLNGDLANGSATSRAVCSACSRATSGRGAAVRAPASRALRAAFVTAREIDAHVAELAFHRAGGARARARPCEQVRDRDGAVHAREGSSAPAAGERHLAELCEALRVTAQLVEPFLPETAARLVTFLALPEASIGALDLPWGAAFPPGHHTRPPEVLFPRVEVAPE
jgi:methionyl-tRNA synthetase